jgi:lipoprotein-anchoring transpeptidase ErfK/SrfK
MADQSNFNDRWVDPSQAKADEIGRLISQYDWEAAQSKMLNATQNGAPWPEATVTRADTAHQKPGKHQGKAEQAEEALLTAPGPFPRTSGNPEAATAVIVDKKNHVTHLFQKNAETGFIEEVMRTRDATGKVSKHRDGTPEGRYTIMERRMHPTWTDPETMKTYPAGPTNPLGPAAVRLMNAKGERTNIEMHGTSKPGSIGFDASHNCVRHNNADILKMFPYLHVGSPVYITSHYDPVNILKQTDFLRK